MERFWKIAKQAWAMLFLTPGKGSEPFISINLPSVSSQLQKLLWKCSWTQWERFSPRKKKTKRERERERENGLKCILTSCYSMRLLWCTCYLFLSCEVSEGWKNKRSASGKGQHWQLWAYKPQLYPMPQLAQDPIQLLWMGFVMQSTNVGARCLTLPVLLSPDLLRCPGTPSQRATEHWLTAEGCVSAREVRGQLRKRCKKSHLSAPFWHASLSHLQDSSKAAYVMTYCTSFISQSLTLWQTIS